MVVGICVSVNLDVGCHSGIPYHHHHPPHRLPLHQPQHPPPSQAVVVILLASSKIIEQNFTQGIDNLIPHDTSFPLRHGDHYSSYHFQFLIEPLTFDVYCMVEDAFTFLQLGL